MNKSSLTFGTLFAFLAVALGAFGAHGLKTMLTPQALAVWHTAVQYQMFHALALLIIGLLARFLSDARMLVWAVRSMIIGVVLFSGSLYVLALTGIGKLGMITPFGGIAFLLGWLFLLVAVWNAE
ncbi:MAG: DUF423 domain-containing protein [Gammaproteobacteria bacterium]|nr:MAG: DUF423 domain-containing protein [Gammaproteobacteria bacterium]